MHAILSILAHATPVALALVIRQLQHVHATTHPGAKRRARSAPEPAGLPAPSLGQENAAQALLEALAAEADEDEDWDEPAGDELR